MPPWLHFCCFLLGTQLWQLIFTPPSQRFIQPFLASTKLLGSLKGLRLSLWCVLRTIHFSNPPSSALSTHQHRGDWRHLQRHIQGRLFVWQRHWQWWCPLTYNYNNDDSINDGHEPSSNRTCINPPENRIRNLSSSNTPNQEAERRRRVTTNAPCNTHHR